MADAFKDIFGTEWEFFNDAVGDDNPAIYTVVLEVTEVCEKLPLTTNGDIDGTLVVMEFNKEKRFKLIDEQEWDPEPTFILPDGTTKRLDSTDIAFSDFVTEQSFMKEFLENPEKYEAETEEDDWHD